MLPGAEDYESSFSALIDEAASGSGRLEVGLSAVNNEGKALMNAELGFTYNDETDFYELVNKQSRGTGSCKVVKILKGPAAPAV